LSKDQKFVTLGLMDIKSAEEVCSNNRYVNSSAPMHLVVYFSYDGILTQSSVAPQGIFGWGPEETNGQSIYNFIDERDHEDVKKKLSLLATKAATSVGMQTRCIHRDGSVHMVSWTGVSQDGLVCAIGTDSTQDVENEKVRLQKAVIHREYQTRFKTFFEQSTLAMEIYSLDGYPLAVNKAWEELFETTREQVAGYNVLKDPLIKNAVLWDCLQRAYSGESVEVPAFWYDPSVENRPGRARWIEAWISPVKDESNEIREIAMILKDVTEKIEIEKALVKSILERKATEEKFQMISDRLGMAVRAGNIGIWEWIPNTNYVYWDETAESLYGYEAGGFSRTTEELNERIHPEDREKLWKTIKESLTTKKPYIIDHRIIRKDGVQRWVQESGMALYDKNEQPYHMMGTVMDITDRVVAEADQKFLSEASDFLGESLDHREILKTLSDHAIEYFCDGVFIDELLPEGGLKRLMIVHPDEETKSKLEQLEIDFPERYENNPVMDTLISGKPMFVPNSNIFLDQLRKTHSAEYIEAARDLKVKSSIRVRLKGRESILGMITFVTMENSSKVLEKRHTWLAEELAYRASMAFENSLIHLSSQEAIRSRDEFLSIASHELKTPLQSLTLQNQMRKRNLNKKLIDAFTPEKFSTMIEADLRHLMRINRLIDDMLDISRIRAGKLTFMKEEIEFCSFVKDVLERFRPQLESVGCFMTVYYTEAINANIDIYRIEQVIVNLLTNAMKYGAGKPIKVEMLKKNEKIQLHVHDQGPGIKKQDTERIFERFERAISSNEVSGLGLGLYISRQIMEQNDGRLYVRSTHGSGSSFIMELPVASESDAMP
jgi:PAS domain S-box-containing protein